MCVFPKVSQNNYIISPPRPRTYKMFTCKVYIYSHAFKTRKADKYVEGGLCQTLECCRDAVHGSRPFFATDENILKLSVVHNCRDHQDYKLSKVCGQRVRDDSLKNYLLMVRHTNAKNIS